MNLHARVQKLEKSAQPAAALHSTERKWGDPMPRYWEDVPGQSWEAACICFAVQPTFQNELELTKAQASRCPLHGLRFTQHEPITWTPRWVRNTWLDPNESSPQAGLMQTKHWHKQQQKAWLATFPFGFLPVQEWFETGVKGMQIREVSLTEWLAIEEEQDRLELCRNALTDEQARKRLTERRKRFERWL